MERIKEDYCNFEIAKLLKESEDEMMVKFIKNQLFNIKKTITDNYELDAKLTKAIDWLEKQGKNPVDKIEPKFKVGDMVRNIKNGKESVISEMLEYVYGGIIPFYIKDQDEWELVEQKSWSEEDEKTLNSILSCIKHCQYEDTEARYNGNHYVDPKRYEPMSDWLKSLKPQSQWKPSNDQIKALDNARHSNPFNVHVLDTLFHDLEKIKGGKL